MLKARQSQKVKQKSTLKRRKSKTVVSIIPYLTFNGNCTTAMKFYQECLGGDLYYQTVGDIQKNRNIKDVENIIVHARLTNKVITIMGSDIVAPDKLNHGHSVSISIITNDSMVIHKYFKNLSVNANEVIPIYKTIWGTSFGCLTDQFNKQWMFILNSK